MNLALECFWGKIGHRIRVPNFGMYLLGIFRVRMRLELERTYCRPRVDSFEPSSWILSGRSLWYFGLSTLSLSNCLPEPSIFIQMTVRFDQWPFCSKNCPLSTTTDYFAWNNCPFWLKTVHFWTDRPCSRDRSLRNWLDKWQSLPVARRFLQRYNLSIT